MKIAKRLIKIEDNDSDLIKLKKILNDYYSNSQINMVSTEISKPLSGLEQTS